MLGALFKGIILGPYSTLLLCEPDDLCVTPVYYLLYDVPLLYLLLIKVML